VRASTSLPLFLERDVRDAVRSSSILEKNTRPVMRPPAFLEWVGRDRSRSSAALPDAAGIRFDPCVEQGSKPHGLAIDAAENSYITGNASGNMVSFGPHSFVGNSEFDDEVFVVKYGTGGTP